MAGVRKRGKKWYYRYTNEDGVEVETVGCSNKGETERIAAGVEARVARIKAGLIDAKAERYAAEARKPLAVHLEDFRAYLLSKGGTEKHADNKATRAERLLLELAECKSLSDVTITSVQGAIAKLDAVDLSTQTQNHYLDAAKMFCSWMVRDKRWPESPIEYLSRRSTAADLRRVRRALTADECRRLFLALDHAQTIDDMTPDDRRALYLVAVGTGFRASELKSLTPASFDLDSETPSIVVKAGYTKNKNEAKQPIDLPLAMLLREWLAGKPKGKSVFVAHKDRFCRNLKADLLLAGIEPVNEEGVIDVHALRATYVTLLVSSGATVKEAQTLARHSTPTLTFGVYAKAQASEINAAVKRLPDHSKKSEEE